MKGRRIESVRLIADEPWPDETWSTAGLTHRTPIDGTAPSRKPRRASLTTYRDRAVVLRKLDYGEADRIFTLLTRTHGKVGAIAKGVRRPESKLGPSLELYGHVDVLLAQGPGRPRRRRAGAAHARACGSRATWR